MTAPLIRPMNVIAGFTNVSNLSSNGERAWTPYLGDSVCRVTDEGDVVLDLHDLEDQKAFLDDGVLTSWAEALGFNIDGIDPLVTYYALESNVLRPYFEDLAEDNPFNSPSDALATGEDFRISVNRDFIVSLLVDIFDGPFDDTADFFNAVTIRFGPNAARADE